MSRFVKRAAGTPLSAEAHRQLEKLAAMPDSEINTSDAPEWTEEQFAVVRTGREVRVQQVQEAQKKAS